MPEKNKQTPQSNEDDVWAELVEEMRAEYWADDSLTVEEKRRLDALEGLSEEEWEPIDCPGKPLSETILEERGTR